MPFELCLLQTFDYFCHLFCLSRKVSILTENILKTAKVMEKKCPIFEEVETAKINSRKVLGKAQDHVQRVRGILWHFQCAPFHYYLRWKYYDYTWSNTFTAEMNLNSKSCKRNRFSMITSNKVIKFLARWKFYDYIKLWLHR